MLLGWERHYLFVYFIAKVYLICFCKCYFFGFSTKSKFGEKIFRETSLGPPPTSLVFLWSVGHGSYTTRKSNPVWSPPPPHNSPWLLKGPLVHLVNRVDNHPVEEEKQVWFFFFMKQILQLRRWKISLNFKFFLSIHLLIICTKFLHFEHFCDISYPFIKQHNPK